MIVYSCRLRLLDDRQYVDLSWSLESTKLPVRSDLRAASSPHPVCRSLNHPPPPLLSLLVSLTFWFSARSSDLALWSYSWVYIFWPALCSRTLNIIIYAPQHMHIDLRVMSWRCRCFLSRGYPLSTYPSTYSYIHYLLYACHVTKGLPLVDFSIQRAFIHQIQKRYWPGEKRDLCTQEYLGSAGASRGRSGDWRQFGPLWAAQTITNSSDQL